MFTTHLLFLLLLLLLLLYFRLATGTGSGCGGRVFASSDAKAFTASEMTSSLGATDCKQGILPYLPNLIKSYERSYDDYLLDLTLPSSLLSSPTYLGEPSAPKSPSRHGSDFLTRTTLHCLVIGPESLLVGILARLVFRSPPSVAEA